MDLGNQFLPENLVTARLLYTPYPQILNCLIVFELQWIYRINPESVSMNMIKLVSEIPELLATATEGSSNSISLEP